MSDRWLSPPQVAKQLGVDPAKVIGWLRRGELVGVNVADRLGGRPRYRIDPAELAAFLQRRSTARDPKPTRHPRRSSGFTRKYYA